MMLQACGKIYMLSRGNVSYLVRLYVQNSIDGFCAHFKANSLTAAAEMCCIFDMRLAQMETDVEWNCFKQAYEGEAIIRL
jgi:hypothetical protein